MTTIILEENQNKQGTIVFVRKNKVFTTVRTIAKNCNIEVRSLRLLVKKYEKRLLKRGSIDSFQMNSLGTAKNRKDTELNEEQAYFLMTLLDNSEVVVDFKDQLTAAFFRVIKENTALKAKLASQSWQSARLEGKIQRRSFSDVIKEFSEYALLQGSSRKDGQYMLISKKIKQTMFDIKYKQDSFRDFLDVEQLQSVVVLESIIEKMVRAGIEAKTHYREIREDIFEKVEVFASAVGKTQVEGICVRNQMELDFKI